MKKVLCVISGGGGGLNELRARRLASSLQADITFFIVERTTSHSENHRRLRLLLTSQPWDIVYQEGTGIVGGMNLIWAAHRKGLRFIVSSGDPIGGYFTVTRGRALGHVFSTYERLLYRASAGFVGWTPYLTGVALSMGARRAATIEGGADLNVFEPCSPTDKIALKQRFGIDPEHLVCGMVGSLNWRQRQSYCYGLELVETLKRIKRTDVSVMIVGDGDGRAVLEERLPDALRSRVIFTGRLKTEDEVAAAINAMDIGFVTQTLDGLGSYRLTTKLPEYLACGLPVAMSPIPGFYDYVAPAGWALPPFHPNSRQFHEGCAEWLETLDWTEVRKRSSFARPKAVKSFDYDQIQERFRDFVYSVMS